MQWQAWVNNVNHLQDILLEEKHKRNNFLKSLMKPNKMNPVIDKAIKALLMVISIKIMFFFANTQFSREIVFKDELQVML